MDSLARTLEAENSKFNQDERMIAVSASQQKKVKPLIESSVHLKNEELASLQKSLGESTILTDRIE